MNNKRITHLIVDTSSSDEDFNGGCDYCLVEMTAEYVSWLLQHMDRVVWLRKIDSGVYALECWDAGTGFFRDNGELTKLIDPGEVNLHSGDSLLLDVVPKIGEEHFQRVECQTVQIAEDVVWWTAYPKHTNIQIESTRVPKETLLQILESFGRTHSPCSMDGDSAIRRIHDLLYLDADGNREFYKPDKEWDADTVSAIAEVVAQCIPRPKET
jgi:hypothetical protein